MPSSLPVWLSPFPCYPCCLSDKSSSGGRCGRCFSTWFGSDQGTDQIPVRALVMALGLAAVSFSGCSSSSEKKREPETPQLQETLEPEVAQQQPIYLEPALRAEHI